MGSKVGRFIVGAVLIGASLMITGPGIWAAGTQLLKGLLFSAGMSLATGALIPSGVKQKQGSILLNIADNQAPLPVVYGETKVGLRLTDIRTAGADNKDLYIVGALCHGSTDGTGIQAIREIFFDDRMAVNSLGQIQAPFSSDNLAWWTNPGSDSQGADGILNSLFPSAWPSTSAGKGVAYIVFKLIYNPEIFPTGIPNITVMVRGAKVNDYRVAKTVSAWGTTGSNVLVTTLTPHFLVTGDSVTIYQQDPNVPTGRPAILKQYAHTVVVVNSTQFTLTGEPGGGGYIANSAAVVKAIHSANPAMCIANYLTDRVYGHRADHTELDLQSFIDMANYCDTVITKHSARNSLRFTCNGWVDVGQSNQENLRQLLTSCRGNLVYEGGKYRLAIRQAQTPTTFKLDETNIHGGWRFHTPGVKECANLARITYVEPAKGPYIISISNDTNPLVATDKVHNFEVDQIVYIHEGGAPQGMTPGLLGAFKISSIASPSSFHVWQLDGTNLDLAPGTGYAVNSCQVTTEPFPHQPELKVWPLPGTVNGFLVADNNYEVPQDYELPFTTDSETALQIGMIQVRESRAAINCELLASEAALQLRLLDVVPITHSTPGWIDKPFWVMSIFLHQEGGLVSLGLVEYDVNAYNLDLLNSTPTPPSTHLPNPFDVDPVLNLDLLSGDDEATPDQDGSHRVYIRANWDTPSYPYVDYYEVEYKRSDTPLWITGGDSNREDTTAYVGPVSEGVSYDVRVRVVNTIGRTSQWVSDTIVPNLPTGGRHGNSWFIDDFTSATPGRRWIQTAGAGSFVDEIDPDAIVGGKVGRAYGEIALEHADAIPFDPNVLYHMRIRCRQYRDPVAGTKQFSAGVNALAQVPGQPGVFQYVNVVGQNNAANQHYFLANHVELVAGRLFQNFLAHFKGFAGEAFPLQSTMVTHTGMASFDAVKAVNGSVDLTNIAWDAAAAAAGSVVVFDLLEDTFITDAWLHMAAGGSVDGYELEFADSSGGPWTSVNP